MRAGLLAVLFLLALKADGSCTMEACEKGPMYQHFRENCRDSESCRQELQWQANALVPQDRPTDGSLEPILGDNPILNVSRLQKLDTMGSYLRIPVPLGETIERSLGMSQAIDVTARFTGNWTRIQTQIYHTSIAVRKHLVTCEKFCQDSDCKSLVNDEIKRLDEVRRTAFDLILPWISPLSLAHSKLPTERVLNATINGKTCLNGARSMEKTCLEGMRRYIEDKFDEPSRIVSSLKNLTQFSKTTPEGERWKAIGLEVVQTPLSICMFDSEDCFKKRMKVVRPAMIGLNRQAFFGMTDADIEALAEPCLRCWKYCSLKCLTRWRLLDYQKRIKRGRDLVLMWAAWLCDSWDCRNSLIASMETYMERTSSQRLMASTSYGLLEPLDAVLGLAFACIVVACGAAVLFYGFRGWKDFQLGLWITICVIGWSFIQIGAFAFSYVVYMGTLDYDDMANIVSNAAGVLILVLWSQSVALLVQVGLFSALFLNWLFVVIKSEKVHKVLKVVLIVVLSAVGLTVVALLISGSVQYMGSVRYMAGEWRFGAAPLVLFFVAQKILLTVLVVVLVGCIVCCVYGLKLLEKKEDRTAIVQSIAIFLLVLCAAVLKTVYVWLVHVAAPNESMLFTIQMLVGDPLIGLATLCLAVLGVRAVMVRSRGFDSLQQNLLQEEKEEENAIPAAYNDL